MPWYGHVPPSVYPLLEPAESVKVIEAAPVDARIAELEAEIKRIRQERDDFQAELQEVLDAIKDAQDYDPLHRTAVHDLLWWKKIAK